MITKYPRQFDRPFVPIKKEKLPKEKSEKNEMRIYQGASEMEFGERLEAMHSPDARKTYETVCEIARAIAAERGKVLLVGGCVRDEVLGIESKDFDIEVYGLTPDKVEEVARRFGRIDAVGRAFGILKLHTNTGFDIDISLPRKDSKIAEGHRGFEVKVDPHMSIKEAARRRDFTFNALAKDPLTGDIFDPFGGVEDLRTRTLRVTDRELFKDDPLRIMRAAQFVGRFGLRIDIESMQLMQSMLPELQSLPKERMREEWEKLLLKSARPSMGLQALLSIGVIGELYPELAGLETTPQEFEWHPEGDVWIHTLMVTDSGREIARSEQLDKETTRVVVWASLCHDLGKPATTTFEDGRLRSKAHEPAGEKPTRTFLEKVGLDKETIEKVVALVREHLWPSVQYINHQKGVEITDGAFRRVAKRIHPANIRELTYVAEADHTGRGPFFDAKHLDQFLLPDPYVAGKWVRDRAIELGIYRQPPKPIILGKDLLALGFKPGKDFGEIIRLAEDCRNDFGMTREKIIEIIGASGSAKEAIIALTRELGMS